MDNGSDSKRKTRSLLVERVDIGARGNMLDGVDASITPFLRAAAGAPAERRSIITSGWGVVFIGSFDLDRLFGNVHLSLETTEAYSIGSAVPKDHL